MRRHAALITLLALVACGGSTPTTPPPAGNTPASIAVQAGDAQQAEPGAAVTIKPAVIVKDASGLPVSGVTVSFAVDSGGGTLTGASSTTGSNGIATVGGWTLGNAEGRNVVKATAGSLAPVKIVATAMISGASLPPATIGAGGGSINVTQAGPLNGFRLDIPSGAFPSGVQATVSYASSINVPRSPTVNPISPLITITTNTAAYATTPLTIHIAASVPVNTFPVIMMYNQATGAMEALTTVSWNATGVTALTNALDASSVLATPIPFRQGGASLTDPTATVFVDAIPTTVLMADYDSGFRPGTDDWEFTTTWTELTTSNPLNATIGAPATSLWYYINHRGAGALNGKFMEQAGVPLSDRRGLRWVGVIGAQYDASAAEATRAGLASRAGNAVAFDQNQFLVIRSRFARAAESGTTPRPQLIVGTAEGIPIYFVVYRVTGTRLYVADPYRPGDVTRFFDFPANAGMTDYVTGPNVNVHFSEPFAVGLSTLIPLDQFPSTYAKVLDGTIGQAQFPSYEFHSWFGRVYDTLFVVDTLRVWIECPGCRSGFPVTLVPPPGANTAGQSAYDAGTTTPFGFFAGNGTRFLSSSTPPGTSRPLGGMIVSRAVFQSVDAKAWLDWHKYVLRNLETSITPATPTGMITVPLKLKHQATLSLLPASVRYRWDFGDGKPKVTVDNNPNVEHIYDAVGTYPITGEIIDLRNNQVIARATETATITLPHFIWVFQTVGTPNTVLPPGGIGDNDADRAVQSLVTGWMTTLHQTPSSGQVEVLTNGTCKGAVLNMPTTGGGLGPTKAYFGGNCSDPDFVQSFTMGTLGSGTVNGSAVATDADPDAITLPGGSINATMTGSTLSGTIVWRVRYSTGIATYTFTFQAIQTMPVP